jgi:hypothetical protein
MPARRCPCRPGTVRRAVCLCLCLAVARVVWSALLPQLQQALLVLQSLGFGHQHDYCHPKSMVSAIISHSSSRGGHGAAKAEPTCAALAQRARNSTVAGSSAAGPLPTRCICAAEPAYGWDATPAGSWSMPVSCAQSSSGPLDGAVRRRHCGVNEATGRAAWDIEHPPQTEQCSAGVQQRPDDIRILFVSSKQRKRLHVRGCAPFQTPAESSSALPPQQALRSNASSSGLPNGGQCYLEPISSLHTLPPEAFDATIFDVAVLPSIPSYLADDHGRPNLRPLHPRSVVGVMSLEPSSYYPLASEQCRQQREVALDLRPSLHASVPLPYFSWALHPLNLPSSAPLPPPSSSVQR